MVAFFSSRAIIYTQLGNGVNIMSKYTQEQLELKAHIEANNAAFIAEAKASGAVVWGVPAADLDMWAEYGVYNIEQYTRHGLMGDCVDLHKEVHGFKCNYVRLEAMSTEELEQYRDSLLNWSRDMQAAEDAREQARKDEVRARNAEFRQASNAFAQAFAAAK